MKKVTILGLCSLGHLVLEKLLKAWFVKKNSSSPPLIHDLVRLSEKGNMVLDDVQKDIIREDSDIDLAIVFKRLSDPFDMQVELMKLRRQFDTRIEPNPFRESDFQISNPLANEILNTGIEII